MKISIVMATFNGEAYLQEQLDSLVMQTILPDELIVVDDCSSDRTSDILEDFSQSAPFYVKLIKKTKRLGYARAFSDAIGHAQGEIILFCDQDDYWEPIKISDIVNHFEKNKGVELVIHNISVCNDRLHPIITNYFVHLERNSYSRALFIKGCATSVRRRLCNSAFPLPSDGRWAHDNRIHALAQTRNSIGYLERVLIKHRIHSSNTSGYVISSKGHAGNLLAKLDSMAIKSSPRSYLALLYFPSPPIQKQEIEEFLYSYKKGMSEDAGHHCHQELFLTFNNFNERESIRRMGSKAKRIYGLVRHFTQRKYHDNGNIYAFLADVARTLKKDTQPPQ